jgi:hypothetical protein
MRYLYIYYLSISRDSFITAVCKASLPPHYTLSVLKATPSTQLVSGAAHPGDAGSDGGGGGATGGAGHWEGGGGDYRHQVRPINMVNMVRFREINLFSRNPDIGIHEFCE